MSNVRRVKRAPSSSPVRETKRCRCLYEAKDANIPDRKPIDVRKRETPGKCRAKNTCEKYGTKTAVREQVATKTTSTGVDAVEPIQKSSRDENKPEKILEHRMRNDEKMLLIKFRKYGREEWIPAKEIGEKWPYFLILYYEKFLRRFQRKPDI